MHWKQSLWSVSVCVAMAGRSLFAAEPFAADLAGGKPPCAIPSWTPAPGSSSGIPSVVEPRPGQPVQPGQGDLFAQAPEAGTGGTGPSFNPNMFGDFQASQFNSTLNQFIPDVARGAFKIADNESPRPQDRFFIDYNYFSIKAPQAGLTTRINVNREIIGGEKTFLDGDASVGIRVPYYRVNTSRNSSTASGALADSLVDDINRSDVGDISFIGKYAFINCKETGNVLSSGLVVTANTGPNENVAFTPVLNPVTGAPLLGTPVRTTSVNSTLLQPFVGGIYNMGDFYVHGFTSVEVPTDSRDVTYLFNDYGVGYFAYRCNDGDRLLTALVPTVELHVNTPLNHRGSTTTPIGGTDVIDLTGGLTVGLGSRVNLMLGGVVPVTGPKPFDYEAQAFLNFRF